MLPVRRVRLPLPVRKPTPSNEKAAFSYPRFLSALAGNERAKPRSPAIDLVANVERDFGCAVPAALRAYLDRFTELAECPIGLLSVGPDRTATIIPDGSLLEPFRGALR